MSREFIAYIEIIFVNEINEEIVTKIKSFLKEETYDTFEWKGHFISFKLCGNNGIDYDCLDNIKKEFRGKIEEIGSGEWVQSDDGYYYRLDEDDEEYQSVIED